MGVMRPELVMKSIVPVVMAGVLGIYGLIIAVIISTGSKPFSRTMQFNKLYSCAQQLTYILQLLDTACLLHAVNQSTATPYYLFDGYAHLAAGLSCGLAGLAAGMAIGIVGDAGVRQAPDSYTSRWTGTSKRTLII